MNNTVNQTVNGGFGIIMTAFLVDAVGHMIPWLIVMTSIIIADLISGLYKSYHLGVKIRPSKAIRETMAKIVTYYGFVVAACMVQVASSSDSMAIEKWSCLIVCFIEGSSVVSNILRTRGVTLDFNELVKVALRKITRIDKEDADSVVKDS